MLAVIIGTFILLSVFIGVTWCSKRYHQKRLMMSKQTTRQLTPDKNLNIFMRVPNPITGLLAFDAMLDAADKITKQLQGRLCDEKRQTLTQSTLESMRSQILNFNLMKEGDNH